MGVGAQEYLEADGMEVEARLVGARLERLHMQQVVKGIVVVHKSAPDRQDGRLCAGANGPAPRLSICCSK